ncbi:MAG: VWA domain-containing protein, partial [Phycisphaerales bacterium]
TYIFPLPDNADLTEFQMTFNGKMVKGEVLKAKEAAQIYESIVRQMKDPGLIEFIGRRLLKMRVFPIEPESNTTIQVRYQQICRPISGMKGYHYPLRTRKTAGQAYGAVRFAVDLQTKAGLKNIWSPSHAVEIVRKGENKALIAYEAQGGSLEDDFLLLYDTDESDLGMSVVAYKPSKDEPGHFVLMLTPKQLWPEQSYQPQDVVFVVDTSGSMSGEKIKQAKAALNFCIGSLDERDRFNIVRFSTGFDPLFQVLQPAGEDARGKASQFIDSFNAAGGTNITDTLSFVMDMPRLDEKGEPSDRPFVVVFLTDGQGNREPNEIMSSLKAIEKGAGKRIFPFGVGHDVNTVLLDQLSNTYHGKVTYVQPGENLELVLGDFFAVISKPVLTNLKLILPEIGATEKFPATLGDLYCGQQLIIAGKYATDTAGTVRLTATREGEAVEYAWPTVSFRSTDEATYVPAVWAGRKISYLIDQIRTHGESEEMIGEVIALSMEYGIQTPYTSWLVNPEKVHLAMPMRNAAGTVRRSGLGGGLGSGLGSGGGRASASAAMDRAASRGVAIEAEPAASPAGLSYGDEFGNLDLLLADQAVSQEAGEAANLIARKNAELREMRSRDEDRLNAGILPMQKIDGAWYHRIGRYLVDEAVDEETEFLVVKFGSNAYFELVQEVARLRPIFAAGTFVVVKMTETHAVLISDRTGIEDFSDDERKQIDLAAD